MTDSSKTSTQVALDVAVPHLFCALLFCLKSGREL